jgi:hypothetical protein
MPPLHHRDAIIFHILQCISAGAGVIGGADFYFRKK